MANTEKLRPKGDVYAPCRKLGEAPDDKHGRGTVAFMPHTSV